MRHATWFVGFLGALAVTVSRAEAQPLGTFRWQLQPFCNAVTLTVVQQGALYQLDGFDDQCGGANPRAPLVGMATSNPDGTIGFGLNLVTTPGGAPVHVQATITPATLGGTWTDSAGNSGTFAFNGAAAGSPRPTPAGVAFSAATVAGAVTAGSVSSTGAGSFGSLTLTGSADIAGGITGGTITGTGIISRTGTILAQTFNNVSVGGASLDLFRGRGSITSPALPLSGDILGTLTFQGLTNPPTGRRTGASITAVTTENWSFTDSGARLVFSTNANNTNVTAPRMVIDQNGEVGIGTFTPDQLLSVNGNASKVGGGSWAVFSDERLKQVHGSFGRGLREVMQLQPIRFEYAPDNPLGLRGDGEYVGFSAQAVKAVIPEAVRESSQGYLQLHADPILWAMLNAVKDLKVENDDLRTHNAELERRLAALEAALSARR